VKATQNAGSPEPQDANSTQPQNPTIQRLEESAKALEHALEQALEQAVDNSRLNKDDVRFEWNFSVVTGDDQPIAHLVGGSTMHHMLADNMLAQAPSRAGREIKEKITLPMLSILQAKVQRMALDRTAANGDAPGPMGGANDAGAH